MVDDHAGQVLTFLDTFIAARASTVRQRTVLEKAIEGLRWQIQCPPGKEELSGPLPCICLAPWVYAAVAGDALPAIPLAAASTLVFLGADILDDLADGDLRSHWEGFSPGEITLAAATCLSCLPQLIIAELDASPTVRDRLQRTLAEGLLGMASGQHQDLVATIGKTSNDVSPANVETAVVAKSGREFALFCRLGAELAEADNKVVARYTEMGLALGAGLQLASDCYETFEDPAGRDFAAEHCTLPIAFHLSRLTGSNREDFQGLLAAARQDDAARQDVRDRLRASGDLRRCAFVVEVYRQCALRALREAQPRKSAAGMLSELIDGISFFVTNPEYIVEQESVS